MQPPGFVITREEGKVLQLRKAAPRAWNAKLNYTLKEMGFKQSEHEHAIYRRITTRQSCSLEYMWMI
jgi:hypothetical protein